ncbi:MAG: alpha/beta hydrolase [Siphonobacter sp.]
MKLLLTSILSLIGIQGFAQQQLALYDGPIPNSRPNTVQETVKDGQIVAKVTQPTLTVFLPPKEKATGTAVIICPGGGYGVLVMKREGTAIAEAFVRLGIAAFVLKYRLPSSETMPEPAMGPLQDAQRAIQLVRQRAAEWQINPQKIGIMGFSAGGHLASTAGTHFTQITINNPSQTSLRPDFMILVYPVISFQAGLGHSGSRNNLLGTHTELINQYSNQLHVTENTPPAFLTHGRDDTVVPVGNSLVFYQALLQNQVPAELHLYTKGQHGYPQTPSFEEWFGRCQYWLKEMNFTN